MKKLNSVKILLPEELDGSNRAHSFDGKVGDTTRPIDQEEFANTPENDETKMGPLSISVAGQFLSFFLLVFSNSYNGLASFILCTEH